MLSLLHRGRLLLLGNCRGNLRLICTVVMVYIYRGFSRYLYHSPYSYPGIPYLYPGIPTYPGLPSYPRLPSHPGLPLYHGLPSYPGLTYLCSVYEVVTTGLYAYLMSSCLIVLPPSFTQDPIPTAIYVYRMCVCT